MGVGIKAFVRDENSPRKFLELVSQEGSRARNFDTYRGFVRSDAHHPHRGCSAMVGHCGTEKLTLGLGDQLAARRAFTGYRTWISRDVACDVDVLKQELYAEVVMDGDSRFSARDRRHPCGSRCKRIALSPKWYDSQPGALAASTDKPHSSLLRLRGRFQGRPPVRGQFRPMRAGYRAQN